MSPFLINKTKTLIAPQEKRSYFRFTNFTRCLNRIISHWNGNYAYNNYYLPPFRDQANKPIILLAAIIIHSMSLPLPLFWEVCEKFVSNAKPGLRNINKCVCVLGLDSSRFANRWQVFSAPVRSVSRKTFMNYSNRNSFPSVGAVHVLTFRGNRKTRAVLANHVFMRLIFCNENFFTAFSVPVRLTAFVNAI